MDNHSSHQQPLEPITLTCSDHLYNLTPSTSNQTSKLHLIHQHQQQPLGSMDHLLDTLITLTNQLIQSSTLALSSTISSRKSFLSTCSKFESLIDRSIQTHQLELNLKLHSIHRHQPILNSPLSPPDLSLAWPASDYELNRSFLRSLLNQSIAPPHSKTTLVQSEKEHAKRHQIQPTTTKKESPDDVKPVQPPLDRSYYLSSTSPRSNSPFDHLTRHTPSLNSHCETKYPANPDILKLASPVVILPHYKQHESRSDTHFDSPPNPDSTHHYNESIPISRPPLSTFLSSPARIQKETSSSLMLSSPSIRIPYGPDPYPTLPPLPSPSNLTQIQPRKSSPIPVLKLPDISASDHHHHHDELISVQSSLPPYPTDASSKILSNTSALPLPPLSHHHEYFDVVISSDSLKQIDLDFKLVHSCFNTP